MKFKKFLSVFAAVALLIVSMVPATILAEETTSETTVNAFMVIEASDEPVNVSESITATNEGQSAIAVTGNATINIVGDVTLTGANGGAGIYVAPGVTLTITGKGTLTAIGNAGADTKGNGAAGIGGTYANKSCGNIVIDNVTVIAKGYGDGGSGIGSGHSGISGTINIINQANVTAYGGHYADGDGTQLQSNYGSSDPEGSAAIGGGAKTNGVIGNITISDSTVTAYGGSKAAGIGCAFWSSCESIAITNSTITAQGGSSSAAIGTSRAGINGVYANISIVNSTVNATGGEYGSAIGGGYNGDSLTNLPTTSIAISGGNITAVGGNGGAAIGGGYKTNHLDIDITEGAVIDATAGAVEDKENPAENCANAIGSGANGSKPLFYGSSVTIAEDVVVEATTNGGKLAVEATDENDLHNSIEGDVTVIIEDPQNRVAVSKSVRVIFEKVSEKTWDIALESTDGKYINRLSSVDLTFVNNSTGINGKPVSYEIAAVDEMTLTPYGTDGYMFNFRGIPAPDKTDLKITIGQVTFGGYGEIDFKVDDTVTTNIANAAEPDDNIVDYFVPGGSTTQGVGELVLNEEANGGVIDDEIKIPVSDLTINITFPNAVEINDDDYQEMYVTVSGADLDNDIEINLGTKTITGNKTASSNVVVEEGAYVITLNDELTTNRAYAVIVTGEGYRTARYTVTMTEAKTLNFWNNVMDDEHPVEVSASETKGMKTKNFLAGDIVADNNINIYDLSAVVSYFSHEANLQNGYVKYDLNRDGVIDSKDVAYVLVSWDE